MWKDLDDNEMVNINYALVRHGALQLVVNDGVSKLGAGRCVIDSVLSLLI